MGFLVIIIFSLLTPLLGFAFTGNTKNKNIKINNTKIDNIKIYNPKTNNTKGKFC